MIYVYDVYVYTPSFEMDGGSCWMLVYVVYCRVLVVRLVLLREI